MSESLLGKDGRLFELPITGGGRNWDFSIYTLATPAGISTQLQERKIGRSRRPEVMLDWSDVLKDPGLARMHMYPGVEKNVTFAEKKRRMETWQSAILTYDEMMDDVEEGLSTEDAMGLFARHHLPRPRIAVLDTGTPGLIKLFEKLEFPRNTLMSKPFTPDWGQLVKLSKTGELVQSWESIKRTP